MGKISNHYDYWAGSAYADADSKLEKLLVLRNSVKNFVNIATGKNIPVKFAGMESRTDFTDIVISTDPKIKNFDVTVGLALHEASHIKLTVPFYRVLAVYYLDHPKEVDTISFQLSQVTLREMHKAFAATTIKSDLTVFIERVFYPFHNLPEERRNYFMSIIHEELLSNPEAFIAFEARIKELLKYSIYRKQLIGIENILEDRRIDQFMLRTCPGYVEYYTKLYGHFFDPIVLEKEIRSKDRFAAFEEAIETEDRYRLTDIYVKNLFGFILKNPVTDIYPGSKELYEMLDIKNIGKNISNTKGIVELSMDTYIFIQNQIDKLIAEKVKFEIKKDQAEASKPGQGNDFEIDTNEKSEELGGEKEEEQKKDDSEKDEETINENKTEKKNDKDENKPESNDTEPEEADSDSESDDSNDDESSDGSEGDSDTSTDDTDSDDAGDDDDSGNDSGESNDSESEESVSGDGSGNGKTGTSEETGDETSINESSLSDEKGESQIDKLTQFSEGELKLDNGKLSKAEIRRLKELAKAIQAEELEIQEVQLPHGKTLVNVHTKVTPENLINRSIPNTTSYPRKHEESFAKGRMYGIQLGRKLKTYAEVQELISNRLRQGKLDKRMIARGSYLDQIFYTKKTFENPNGYIELTVDASGSMCGENWESTIEFMLSLAIACKASKTIDLRINYRAQHNNTAAVVYIYDSKKTTIPQLENTLMHINASGGTPEAICYAATMANMKSFLGKRKGLFITITDGSPAFPGYSDYITHTRQQVSSIKAAGYDVVALYVDYGGQKSYDFDQMYGADGHAVNPDEISQFASILNDKFKLEGQ